MGKSSLPPGFVNVSFRLSASIVAQLDEIAATTPGISVLYPLTRSDVLRAAVDRHIRAERRREARI